MQTTKDILAHTLKNLLGVMFISCIADVGYKLYQSVDFQSAFSYWITNFFTPRRMVIWVVVAILVGFLSVKFRKKE